VQTADWCFLQSCDSTCFRESLCSTYWQDRRFQSLSFVLTGLQSSFSSSLVCLRSIHWR